MKIDDDSYFIRYGVNKCGEYANMTHYISVWWNGMSLDSFSFCRDYIDFEAADWNGIDPDRTNVGKRIFGRYYRRWEARVNVCKKEIEQKARQYSSPFGGSLSAGTCLYFPLKEILIAEYLEEFDEDISEEEGPDPYFSLVHITSTNTKPQATEIYVDKYRFENTKKPEVFDKYYIENLEKAFTIPKDVFDCAANRLTVVSTEILEEIRAQFMNKKK